MARSAAEVPGPLRGGVVVQSARLQDVPTPLALEMWLQEKGLPTETWGKDGMKSVEAFWKEIKLHESGLELWKQADGKLQPVRVTHVLRAKVCSPECYERGIFVFNTWQQFADGRRRTRNGLLSEKLSTAEIPLEGRLHQVCQRAIGEEMQRLVDSTFRVGPGLQAPEFDPNAKCPLDVVHERLTDHSIEVEISKSFPGLLTVYHLYTVDIICNGMPSFDFNTLEYSDPDGQGHRPLKYVHAWVWLSWPEIRRYLFEGSKLAQRKTRGAFAASEDLACWLVGFGVDTSDWGRMNFRSVEDLYRELENEETELELWNRHDGVPLLMRVVHLLQLKVRLADSDQVESKFLFQTWQQSPDGRARLVHRFPARKLSNTDLPTDGDRFMIAVQNVLEEEVSYLVDAHFQMRPGQPPMVDPSLKAEVTICECEFKDHRIDVEESPSYKGICTLYHIYTVELACSGLPTTDFGSLRVRHVKSPDGTNRIPQVSFAKGWTWVSWQECLDALHARTLEMERQFTATESAWKSQKQAVIASQQTASDLAAAVQKLAARAGAEDPDAKVVLQLVGQLHERLQDCQTSELPEDVNDGSLTKRLPPSMVTKMAESTLPKDMLTRLEAMRGRPLSGFQPARAPSRSKSPPVGEGKRSCLPLRASLR